MTTNIPEVDENWENFWKPVVTTEDGVSLNKIKRELYDYHELMERAKVVYLAVTGHRTSNLAASADAIIKLFNEHVNDILDEDAEDDIPF